MPLMEPSVTSRSATSPMVARSAMVTKVSSMRFGATALVICTRSVSRPTTAPAPASRRSSARVLGSPEMVSALIR